MTHAIADHPTLKPALQATHQRLTQELLALLAPAPETPQDASAATEAVASEVATPPPVDALRLQYALAHAVLSGEAALADALVAHEGYRERLREMFNETYHQAYYQRAMQWATLEILVRERVLEAGESAEQQNDLASAYNNRGVAHQNLGALGEALADYNQAITLREALRTKLGDAWSVPLQNDLAMAYSNRGNAHSDLGALGEAIADYNQAITLREALRQRLGDAWSAPLQNDLASAYVNCGNAHYSLRSLQEAVEDYKKAIMLWESLRVVLEPQGNWPAAWQGYLDKTQKNYQTVMNALKDQE